MVTAQVQTVDEMRNVKLKIRNLLVVIKLKKLPLFNL